MIGQAQWEFSPSRFVKEQQLFFLLLGSFVDPLCMLSVAWFAAVPRDFSQLSSHFLFSCFEGFKLGSCLFVIEMESTVFGFLVLCQFFRLLWSLLQYSYPRQAFWIFGGGQTIRFR